MKDMECSEAELRDSIGLIMKSAWLQASRMNSSSMALVQLQGRPVNASSPSSSYPPAAGAPWRPAAIVPSASSPGRAVWTPGNHSEAYFLSVVQLADPAHAEMMQLNATTSTKASPCFAELHYTGPSFNS